MNKTKQPISNKEIIRLEVKGKISLLSEQEKNEAALSLCEKLLSSSIIQETQNIIVYQSLSDEISLIPFLEIVQEKGKNIFIIDASGKHSALPSEGVILIPGRAFDLSGKRIGRGGGWYDRFLREHPYFQTIGVCFDCQIFRDLPQDEWDISMNTMIYSSLQRGQ